MGFGVWGLGFGVWGLGFGVWGLGRVQGFEGGLKVHRDHPALRPDRVVVGLAHTCHPCTPSSILRSKSSAGSSSSIFWGSYAYSSSVWDQMLNRANRFVVRGHSEFRVILGIYHPTEMNPVNLQVGCSGLRGYSRFSQGASRSGPLNSTPYILNHPIDHLRF